MRSWLKKLAKRLLVVLGVLVIVLAIAVGAFRVLIARAPSYQAELQAWVAGELGLSVTFDQLDARWALRGPELTLRDVRIGGDGTTETLVTAARAAVGLDAVALLLEREFRVARLSIDGLRLAVERSVDGQYRLVGAPSQRGSGGNLGGLVPELVEVTVRDSEIRYTDALHAQQWQFDDVTMSLIRTADALSIDARALPPVALASRIHLTLDARLNGEDAGAAHWRVLCELPDVDLAALARLLPTAAVYALAGKGDVTVSLEREDGRIARANAEVTLEDVALPGMTAAAEPAFERVALNAEWSQDASGSWQVALADVNLARAGRRWPSGNTSIALRRVGGGMQSLALRSDFLRLDDLAPIVRAFAEAPLAAQWTELGARGDLRAVDFSLLHEPDGQWDYSLAVQFAGLGFAATPGRPGIDGLSGTVTTGARSGTLELASTGVTLDWPEIFAESLRAERVTGSVVWRQGRDVVRVVSSDLTLGVLGTDVRSNLELTLPLDGSSPHLDMESRAARVDLVAAKQFLPVPQMPRAVVSWLESAIRAGTARNLEFNFFGPVAAFPFDGGEGNFRVAADVDNAVLEFITGWPVAEQLRGNIEFVNAGFRARGAGRILGNRSDEFSLEIPELRDAVMTFVGQTEGRLEDVMAFLRSAPLLAKQLGPEYERLRVHSGSGSVDLRLDLPLLERSAFVLDAKLRIAGGELSIDGFRPHATEIDGVLAIDGTTVTGQAIEAIFLEGPVTASVAVSDQQGYRAALAVDGEATADAVLSAFNLTVPDRFAGQTRWQGRLLLPARAAVRSPLRVEVESNLTGVSLKLPAPLAKAPGEPSNLQLEFVIPDAGGLEVDGNLGATRRFALRYARTSEGLEFERGTVQLGGDQPQLPAQQGFTVRGNLPVLDLGEWLALANTGNGERTRATFIGAELDIGEFTAFGQRLGASRVDARRERDAWNVDITSEAIAGNILIPLPLSARPQVVANMQRVYLGGGGDGSPGPIDPRTLPGLALHTDELGLGKHHLGRVALDVAADPLGLRLVSFASATESFAVEGSGSWLVGPEGATTRVAVNITSSDVSAALEDLGFSVFLDGEMADLTASVYWPGPPTVRWRDHVGGDVAVRVETGSLPELDPGAGRVVGLLSIAALPRRLALDFRDVFGRGFVFDEITGDFTLIDGDAYTNDLIMSGPGAEIGVVGRTGLRDRDYQQQAVVTAEPGNMLPTVGALVAGPTVGAAWWLFMRIFKKPLKGIGRASYCITGTWDAPQVERLTGERLEQAEQCAALPPGGFVAEGGTENGQ
jgi:uncharacterized protein (TIGR02099 family)